MLCENCKKRAATFHFTEIVNTQKFEINLCEECAKKKGIGFAFDKTPSTIASFISGLAELDSEERPKGRLICRGCGLTYSEFMQCGKLGCGDCYQSFERNISSLLQRIHGSSQHVGKSPLYYKKTFDQEREIAELRTKLQLAVKREDFEEAAKIRDRIRNLEQRGLKK
jgi:protein arginine kinase activator